MARNSCCGPLEILKRNTFERKKTLQTKIMNFYCAVGMLVCQNWCTFSSISNRRLRTESSNSNFQQQWQFCAPSVSTRRDDGKRTGYEQFQFRTFVIWQLHNNTYTFVYIYAVYLIPYTDRESHRSNIYHIIFYLYTEIY